MPAIGYVPSRFYMASFIFRTKYINLDAAIAKIFFMHVQENDLMWHLFLKT